MLYAVIVCENAPLLHFLHSVFGSYIIYMGGNFTENVNNSQRRANALWEGEKIWTQKNYLTNIIPDSLGKG
jgi:hypothetical protein